MRDQEQDHKHDANAEQRVVREREDCSERSKHKRTTPEENGARSPQESSGRWLFPFGRNGWSSEPRFGRHEDALRLTRQHISSERGRLVRDRSQTPASEVVIEERDRNAFDCCEPGAWVGVWRKVTRAA
jgi:hypothetical protein